MSDERWWIVVIREAETDLERYVAALGPMTEAGTLTLCTEAEADALVDAWTADPSEGGTAHKAEVFHYDHCPLRPPACHEHGHAR